MNSIDWSKDFIDRAAHYEKVAKENLPKLNIHYKKLSYSSAMIRIDDRYYVVSFLGSGAINTYRKIRKEITHRGVSHPHMAYATFETMLYLAYRECFTAEMSP